MSASRAYKVFIVEGDPEFSSVLEDIVRTIGCDVFGPVATLGAAKLACHDRKMDMAIIDADLDEAPGSGLVDWVVRNAQLVVFTARSDGGGTHAERYGRPVFSKQLDRRELTRRLALEMKQHLPKPNK